MSRKNSEKVAPAAASKLIKKNGLGVKNDVRATLRSAFGAATVVATAAALQRGKQGEPTIVPVLSRVRNVDVLKKDMKKKMHEVESVKMAGLKRVGPNTPLGKLRERLKRAREEESNMTASNSRELENILPKLNVQIDKMKKVYATKGIAAARKLMANIPETSELEKCREYLEYWFAWIDLERDAKEWEQVAELFERARVSLTDADKLEALQLRFEEFQTESDEIYSEEKAKLDERLF